MSPTSSAGSVITVDPIEVRAAQKQLAIAALIDEVNAEHGSSITRESSQTTIIASEAYAKANGLTLAYIYSHTKLYKVCKDLEAACQAIEGAP